VIPEYPRPSPPDSPIDEYAVVQLCNGLLKDSILNERDCLEVLPPVSGRLFTIRGRTHGIWEEIMAPPAIIYQRLIRRLKVMAEVDLVRPQPLGRGRFRFIVDQERYDVGITVRARPDGTEIAEIQIATTPADAKSS